MRLNCGIAGLPNVGKSTIFSSLTAAPAEAANYPFCTIEPNKGIVAVPDARLDRIASLVPAEKTIPAVVEFVDIAGLVKGASQGEGLGNRFLGHIREVGMLLHVVRCFEDADIQHVEESVDPIRDIEIIQTELAFADLATVESRIEKEKKQTRGSDKKQREQAEKTLALLARLKEILEAGRPATPALAFGEDAESGAEPDPAEAEAFRSLQLITSKEVLYLCNVHEEDFEGSPLLETVKTWAGKQGASVLPVCGKLEAEAAQLENAEERESFLKEMGLPASGLSRVIRRAYETLGFRTFFTVGGKENKAWTFPRGCTAPQAAGLIHTDFEKGFIKAEVYHCEDLFEAESEQELRRQGRIRLEGRDYVLQDGDVMFFKFNA